MLRTNLVTSVTRLKIKEIYPERIKNGKATRLIQTEAVCVMKELRKKNFVEPLQNAEVATQNENLELSDYELNREHWI